MEPRQFHFNKGSFFVVFILLSFGVVLGQPICDTYVNSKSGNDTLATTGGLRDPFKSISYAITRTNTSVFCIQGTFSQGFDIDRGIDFFGIPSPDLPIIEGTISYVQATGASLSSMSFSDIRFLASDFVDFNLLLSSSLQNLIFDRCIFQTTYLYHGDYGAFTINGTSNFIDTISITNCKSTTDSTLHIVGRPTSLNESYTIIINNSTFGGDLRIEAGNVDSIEISQCTFSSHVYLFAYPQYATDSVARCDVLNSTFDPLPNYQSHFIVACPKFNLQNSVVDGLTFSAPNSLAPSIAVNSWYWNVEGNLFRGNSGDTAVDVPRIPEQLSPAEIRFRRNAFTSSTAKYAIIFYAPPSRNLSIDARMNWFGDASGPTSCCNPGGNGAHSQKGVDYSYYCLDIKCTQFSEFEIARTCIDEQLCPNNEPLTYGISGGVIVVIAVVCAIVFYNLMKIKTTEYRRTWVFRSLSIFLAAEAVVGIAVCAYSFTIVSTLCPGNADCESYQLPVFILTVGVFIEFLTCAVFGFAKITVHFVVALLTALAAVLTPPLTMLVSLSILPREYKGFEGVEISPIRNDLSVFVMPFLTLPGLAILIVLVRFSYKLTLHKTQPELVKLEREMEESETLLSKEGSTLKSNHALKATARLIAMLQIPIILTSLLIMGMGIYYLAVVHVKASSNLSGQFVVITNDTLRLFYASSSLIVTIMGMIVLLKRYYDSIYLWVFSTFSFAMIALSMTSAGFGAAILSQPDPGDLLEGVNWQLAIAFLVLHSLAFVLHAITFVAVFRLRRTVDTELPKIISQNIDRAYDEIYDGLSAEDPYDN